MRKKIGSAGEPTKDELIMYTSTLNPADVLSMLQLSLGYSLPNEILNDDVRHCLVQLVSKDAY